MNVFLRERDRDSLVMVRIGVPSCKVMVKSREKGSIFMMSVSCFLAMRSGKIPRPGAGLAGGIDAMILIVSVDWTVDVCYGHVDSMFCVGCLVEML